MRGWCKRCSTPQLCASQVGSILTGTSGGTQSIDDAIVSDGESDQDHEPQSAEIEGVALASDIGWGICIHRLSSTRTNDQISVGRHQNPIERMTDSLQCLHNVVESAGTQQHTTAMRFQRHIIHNNTL